MPGVPTGRACDACRKQKKKCDEKQPACGRCLRLKVSCVGSGQQRFKFKQEQFHPKSNQSDQKALASRLRSTEQNSSFEIPRACPGNRTTSLTNLFVGAIKRSTDLRYNMWWSFGFFLEEVPRRLGSNEALDRAVDAVTTAHAGFCSRRPVSVEALAKYSYALKTLRVYLDDPLQASTSSTLCAVMILLICQTFIGNNGQLVSGHAQGAASILQARKNFGPRDDFERKLFLSLRGSVLFEGLYNDSIDLSPEEWDALVTNDFDQNLPEGQILRCLARAPVLMKRGKQAIRDGDDLTPLAMEVRSIYETCKLLLGELKARTVEFETSGLSTMTTIFMTRILQAHYLRTYGIGIAITTFFNCILQALDPTDYACVVESSSLVKDTLLHAQKSNLYRPVGAGYVIICLSAAWAVTTDPQLRSMVEVTLIDYHSDFVTRDGVNIPRELTSVIEKAHEMIQNAQCILEVSRSSLDQVTKTNVTTATMSLVLLPTELILVIESNLDSQRDLNAFICTSPRFALMFDDKLYQNNSEHEHDYVILWAATRGLDGTIRKCLKAGAKIQRLDRFRSHLKDRDAPEALNVIPRHPKSHPLTAAAAIGSMSCVRLLLDYGVNPNLLDEHYETPIRQAAGNGHVNVVDLLFARRNSAFSGAFKLRRPLKLAAARGHLHVIKALFSFLERADRFLTVKDAAQIIFYEGLWHRNEDVVRYALEKGADVNDETTEFAMRFAPDLCPDDFPYGSRRKLVQAHKTRLTIHGVSTPGWSTQIPNSLHAALLGGDANLVNLVLEHGFDIPRLGPNALRYAILQREQDLINELANIGIDVAVFHGSFDPKEPLWLELMKRAPEKTAKLLEIRI
ncbi:unnamed protein product [Penicillium glandicola]